MGVKIEIETGEDKASEMEDKAKDGRGGDVIMAHLTPGEVVIPVELALKLEPMLAKEFKAAKMDMNEFIVGHKANKINPETECPEFFSWSNFNPINIVKNAVSSAGSVIYDVLEGFGIVERPASYTGPTDEEIAAQNAAIQKMKDDENASRAAQTAAEEEARAVQAEINRVQEETEKAKVAAEAKKKEIQGQSEGIQRESAERRLSRLKARKRSSNRPMLSSGVSLNSGG